MSWAVCYLFICLKKLLVGTYVCGDKKLDYKVVVQTKDWLGNYSKDNILA